MKIIFLLSLILVSFQSLGQETTPDFDKIKSELNSINMGEIKDTCDCPDAIKRTLDIFQRETKAFSSVDELKTDTRAVQVVRLINKKIFEITNTCDKIDTSDAVLINCASFKTVEEKMRMFKTKFGYSGSR